MFALSKRHIKASMIVLETLFFLTISMGFVSIEYHFVFSLAKAPLKLQNYLLTKVVLIQQAVLWPCSFVVAFFQGTIATVIKASSTWPKLVPCISPIKEWAATGRDYRFLVTMENRGLALCAGPTWKTGSCPRRGIHKIEGLTWWGFHHTSSRRQENTTWNVCPFDLNA